jgi:GT2 family glycosyltransferase
LEKVGFFDEDFFAYLEDVDLSLRLQNAGWKTLCVPQAIAYHLGGGTADRMGDLRYRLVARNWWFIILKHYPARTFFRRFPEIIIEQSKNLVAVRNVKGMLWVVKELLIKWPKIIKKRKPILMKRYQ